MREKKRKEKNTQITQTQKGWKHQKNSPRED
jgi:hypothetical protein